MPATPSTTDPPEPVYPERTQADQDAMFASVVWFDEQYAAGKLTGDEGHYFAVLGNSIIDVDHDEEELVRRLEARESELPPNRVVIRHVPDSEGPIVCTSSFFPDSGS